MNSPCDTCAMGNAGGARDEADNHLTALICVGGAIPFFCHHAKDGHEVDWANDPLGPLSLHPANRKVCAGWQAAVRELHQKGLYKNFLPIRRYVARRALGFLKRMTIPDIGQVKRKEASRNLKRCIHFLGERDIAHKYIP